MKILKPVLTYHVELVVHWQHMAAEYSEGLTNNLKVQEYTVDLIVSQIK